jgi:hypothetical protein
MVPKPLLRLMRLTGRFNAGCLEPRIAAISDVLLGDPRTNLLNHLVIKLPLGKEGCRVVLNEIKLAKGPLKLRKSKIVQSPKRRKGSTTAVNNIAVLDSVVSAR